MPAVDEIATRLDKAKLFTVVDAEDGFRQKKLAREFSYKTTFNTPYSALPLASHALWHQFRSRSMAMNHA